MLNVLMVCLGNICRSPMAEGILRKKVEERGLNITVDSAGFEPYHSGDRPDPRAVLTAKNNGVDISNIYSRIFLYEDFQKFDKIYVMDKWNYNDVISVAKTDSDRMKVDYFLNLLYPNENRAVPDPYYGKMNGFEEVFDELNAGCEVICSEFIRSQRNA